MTSNSSRLARAAVLLLAVLAASAFPSTSAQKVTAQDDDPISIVGTWSTGTGAVETGLSFYNPGNNTFNVPQLGGQSYSFTEDGFWEQALYIFTSDQTNPHCSQAQLIWQHGSFVQNSNGSVTLTPFEGDGRQMIQNGCTEVSQSLQSYDQQEIMQGFYIRKDWHFGVGGYYLQMYQFDGSKKPWLWQKYKPPQMLPTQQLHKKIIGQLNGT